MGRLGLDRRARCKLKSPPNEGVSRGSMPPERNTNQRGLHPGRNISPGTECREARESRPDASVNQRKKRGYNRSQTHPAVASDRVTKKVTITPDQQEITEAPKVGGEGGPHVNARPVTPAKV